MTSTFGNGYFGVGDYGTATPILFTGSAARVGFDSGARVVPRPIFRASGKSEFLAESRVRRTVRTGPHLASSEFVSRSNFWKGPVLEGRARSDFGGSYYFDQSLPDRETMHLCHGRLGLDAATGWSAVLLQRAAFGRMDDTTGRARTIPWAVMGASLARTGFEGQGITLAFQPIKLDAGRVGLRGLTGPGTVNVAFRRSAGRNGLSGAARAQIWALSRGFGASISLRGRFAVKAVFVTGRVTGRPDLRASFRMTYEWSDQTAPGRDPAPAWGGVSEPTDGWQDISANADNWQEV